MSFSPTLSRYARSIPQNEEEEYQQDQDSEQLENAQITNAAHRIHITEYTNQNEQQIIDYVLRENKKIKVSRKNNKNRNKSLQKNYRTKGILHILIGCFMLVLLVAVCLVVLERWYINPDSNDGQIAQLRKYPSAKPKDGSQSAQNQKALNSGQSSQEQYFLKNKHYQIGRQLPEDYLYNGKPMDSSLIPSHEKIYSHDRGDLIVNKGQIQGSLGSSSSHRKKTTAQRISNIKAMIQQRRQAKQREQLAHFHQNQQKQSPASHRNQRVPTKSITRLQPEIEIKLSTECREYIDRKLSENGQLYDLLYPYKQLVQKSKVSEYNKTNVSQITVEQYERAVKLVGLIHHWDFDQQKIVVTEGKQGSQQQTTDNHNACESQESIRNRLQGVLSQEKQYLQEKYQISEYMNRQLRFCIVTNSYMNAHNGLLYRNIDSILQQEYQNYHVVYTDDNSSDGTGQKVKEYLRRQIEGEGNENQDMIHISDKKYFKVITNPQQKGMMSNIYNAITNHCQKGEIVVMLDGDDSFIGRQVLSLYNAVYQKQKLAVIWGQFLTTLNNMRFNVGFSKAYHEKVFKAKAFRKTRIWIATHLKTFWADLFHQIRVEDLQHQNGTFYRGASDTAIMTSLIELGYPHVRYLPEIVYEYRYDTGIVGNKVNKPYQKVALNKIFSKTTPYDSMEDFGFIDRAIERAEEEGIGREGKRKEIQGPVEGNEAAKEIGKKNGKIDRKEKAKEKQKSTKYQKKKEGNQQVATDIPKGVLPEEDNISPQNKAAGQQIPIPA